LIENSAVAVALLILLIVLIAHALRSSTVTPEPLAYHTPDLGAPSGRQELPNLAAAAAREPAAPAKHQRIGDRLTAYLASGWGTNTSASPARTS
jgi:hypothetical protein